MLKHKLYSREEEWLKYNYKARRQNPSDQELKTATIITAYFLS